MASIALPTKSILMPYSQRVPGSLASGVVSAAFLQVVIAGVPVAFSHLSGVRSYCRASCATDENLPNVSMASTASPNLSA